MISKITANGLQGETQTVENSTLLVLDVYIYGNNR